MVNLTAAYIILLCLGIAVAVGSFVFLNRSRGQLLNSLELDEADAAVSTMKLLRDETPLTKIPVETPKLSGFVVGAHLRNLKSARKRFGAVNVGAIRTIKKMRLSPSGLIVSDDTISVAGATTIWSAPSAETEMVGTILSDWTVKESPPRKSRGSQKTAKSGS